MPNITESKKFPLILFQKLFNLNVKRSFKVLRSTLFMELINSSYIPPIKTIVHPDTPGPTSAAPIHIPFTVSLVSSLIFLFIFVISYKSSFKPSFRIFFNLSIISLVCSSSLRFSSDISSTLSICNVVSSNCPIIFTAFS